MSHAGQKKKPQNFGDWKRIWHIAAVASAVPVAAAHATPILLSFHTLAPTVTRGLCICVAYHSISKDG